MLKAEILMHQAKKSGAPLSPDHVRLDSFSDRRREKTAQNRPTTLFWELTLCES